MLYDFYVIQSLKKEYNFILIHCKSFTNLVNYYYFLSDMNAVIFIASSGHNKLEYISPSDDNRTGCMLHVPLVCNGMVKHDLRMYVFVGVECCSRSTLGGVLPARGGSNVCNVLSEQSYPVYPL